MTEKKNEPVFEYTGGPASQTEKEVMHSPYGFLPPPELTQDGKYRCPKCGKVFSTRDQYNQHTHK